MERLLWGVGEGDAGFGSILGVVAPWIKLLKPATEFKNDQQ
jgi:hypothetical protein